MPEIIDNLEKKKKEGYYDYREVDNPIPNSGETVMIPEDGNHPVFTKGGTCMPPPAAKANSTNKKYFF